ncbi:MAG: hypothetical protein KGI97_06120, partial [Alphaproteobacteria bacterium]|nr:hypothetical protein [Alphaproteobacteria bacterium]
MQSEYRPFGESCPNSGKNGWYAIGYDAVPLTSIDKQFARICMELPSQRTYIPNSLAIVGKPSKVGSFDFYNTRAMDGRSKILVIRQLDDGQICTGHVPVLMRKTLFSRFLTPLLPAKMVEMPSLDIAYMQFGHGKKATFCAMESSLFELLYTPQPS